MAYPAIDAIRNRLEKHLSLKKEMRDNHISVFAAEKDGFLVQIDADRNEYTLTLGGYHHHFDLCQDQDAVQWFGVALSGDLRIKVSMRGGTEYRWDVELMDKGGAWVSHETMALR